MGEAGDTDEGVGDRDVDADVAVLLAHDGDAVGGEAREGLEERGLRVMANTGRPSASAVA